MKTSLPAIFIVRAPGQDTKLLERLRGIGREVISFPVMDLIVQEDAIVQLQSLLAHANWIIPISPSAIQIAWPYIQAIKTDAKWACIGPGSAYKLAEITGIQAMFSSTGNDSAALIELFQNLDISHQKILIIGGDHPRLELQNALRSQHAQVTQLEIYQKKAINPSWQNVYPYLQANQVCTWLISSSQMVDLLFNSCPDDLQASLRKQHFISFHENILNTLVLKGVKSTQLCKQSDEETLFQALSCIYDI